MKSGRIALLASEGLLLDGVLGVWHDLPWLKGYEPVLLSAVGADGDTAMFGNRPLMFRRADELDPASVDLLLVLESPLVVESCRDWLLSLPCPVLGDWHSLAGLDPRHVSAAASAGVFAVPQAPATAVTALFADADCESLTAVALLPVSVFGQAGVEELAAQTARLLNAQAVESRVFGQQIAFNCFPAAAMQAVIRDDLKRCYADADVQVSAIQLPVFHGVALQLSVVCAEPVDAEAMVTAWQARGVRVSADAGELSVMAAASEQGCIIAGPPRASTEDAYRLDVWLAFDDIQLYLRKSLLAAAEILLKHDL